MDYTSINSLNDHTSAATRALDLLAANQSDADFERQKESQKILAVCKAKGFKSLEEQGLIIHGARNARHGKSRHEGWEKVMRDSHERVMAGTTYKAEAARLGLKVTTYTQRLWDLGLNKKLDWNVEIPRIIDAVNNQGLSVEAYARSIHRKGCGLAYQLKKHGYTFDRKLRKILDADGNVAQAAI